MNAPDPHRVVEAVWRIESPRLIAHLARIVRDVGLAEDFAQDALLSALEEWPRTGVPDNPGAWLITTARHRAIDFFRRSKRLARKQEELGRELERQEAQQPDMAATLDDDFGDDLLALIFTACHPSMSRDSQVALTLRAVGGLTTEEIARAFLVPTTTVQQRIVRAKRSLSDAGVTFEVPGAAERAERMAAVLDVVYFIFNEGYTATAGDDWMRPDLCNDALRLGRMLQGLAPEQAEVHGLAALMEIQASRLRARSGPHGEVVRLLDQDRSRWDQLLIRRGLEALARAERLEPARGSYTLQAAIAACHARARTAGETDWSRIASLYDDLAAAVAVPGCRAEPRRRRLDGLRPRTCAPTRGRARGRAGAPVLPPAAERAW